MGIFQKEQFECIFCQKSFFNSQNRRRKRCAACNTKIRRFRAKIAAIELLGSKCSGCGYNKHPSALEFHHKDPSQKDFSISSVANKSWKSIVEEVKKCVLLCSNCHRIEHGDRYKLEFIELATQYKGYETFDGYFKKAVERGVIDRIKAWSKPSNSNNQSLGKISSFTVKQYKEIDMSDIDEIYLIVYPKSDKSRLSLVALERCNQHEINDYHLASRHVFSDRAEAVEYAQKLALENGLSLSSSDHDIQEMLQEEDYLD